MDKTGQPHRRGPDPSERASPIGEGQTHRRGPDPSERARPIGDGQTHRRWPDPSERASPVGEQHGPDSHKTEVLRALSGVQRALSCPPRSAFRAQPSVSAPQRLSASASQRLSASASQRLSVSAPQRLRASALDRWPFRPPPPQRPPDLHPGPTASELASTTPCQTTAERSGYK